MLSVWMIYSKSTLHNPYGNNAFSWMVEAGDRHNCKVTIVFEEDLQVRVGKDLTVFHNHQVLNLPHVVIMRCYNEILSRLFEELSIPVINSTEAMIACRDKLRTARLLQSHNIPSPMTLYDTSSDYSIISHQFQNQAFIMKVRQGSKGEGVYLIHNQQEFNACKESLLDKGYIYQEYVAESHGKDLRVYVLGDKVLGGVLRYSHKDFRSNYALGGEVEAYELTPDIEELCVKTAKAVGLEFCGIDLLFYKDSFKVCEVNGNAGFRTITRVSEVDIPDELFGHISRTYG